MAVTANVGKIVRVVIVQAAQPQAFPSPSWNREITTLA